MYKSNFTIIKLILAFIVFITHFIFLNKYVIESSNQYHYLLKFISSEYNFFNAEIAVKIFFSISGYLIGLSLSNKTQINTFYKKRIMRIYPSYITVVLMFFLIALLLNTNSLNIIIFDRETYVYLFSNLLTLNFIQPSIKGFLDQNIINAINGSLWTIKNELVCYFLAPFMFSLIRRNKKWFLFLYIISVSWIVIPTEIINEIHPRLSKQFPMFIPFFISGLFLSTLNLRRKLYLFNLFSILGLISTYLINYLIFTLIFPICITFIIVYLSKNNLDIKIKDYSYGLYLWHFPVIQTIYMMNNFGITNLYKLFIITFSIIMFFVYLNYVFIEDRFRIK